MAIVLIVEDQEQILTLAQSFLEEQGHKTLSAATADEALAILTGSEAVDALFVDIILNGDTQAGLELAKRAVELKPRLKVVYSTGLSVTDEMKASFVPGSAILEKPYTVDQLLTSFSVHFQIGPQLAFEISNARLSRPRDAIASPPERKLYAARLGARCFDQLKIAPSLTSMGRPGNASCYWFGHISSDLLSEGAKLIILCGNGIELVAHPRGR